MRCAARHRLLASNPGAAILLVVFLVGAFFFVLGTVLVRRERRAAQPKPAAPSAPAPISAESFERVEQLLSRGDTASVRELERLRSSGQSAEIRDAADDALIVIASRG